MPIARLGLHAMLLAALPCAPMRAQVPDPGALAQRAQQLATTLQELEAVEQPSDEQKQTLAATEKRLAESDEAQYKNWANGILLVLCIQAGGGYKPPTFESGVLAAIEKDRAVAADIPGIVLAARKALGDPDASCGLSGVHALERIASPPKAPTRK